MNTFEKYLQIAVILTALLAAPGISAGEETLYVFYPSDIRPITMQQKMTEACPGIRVIVFGRFTDFEKRILADRPDAILTQYPVIQQIGGYSVTLKGSRKGETEDVNILVSVDEKIDLKNISSVPIGMLDLLGRNGMKKMAESYFNQAPRLRLVSKREDMLQLLILKMVKAILIPEYQLGYFKELSNMNFVVTRLPNIRTGIIALAVRGSAAQVVRTLTKMDDEIMEMLEVDKWEK